MAIKKVAVKQLAKRIKVHTDAIAAQRDKLRDLIADAEEICIDSDEAIESLESAVETLSRNL